MALNQRKRKFSMAFTSNDDVASSSSTPRWKYDGFLSFRGEDTRKTFVDHLYFHLQRSGIDVLKDDEELRAGTQISPALLEAIEKSRLAIIVFSENYASSRWCLEELVKIVDCKNHKGLKVIPIFYHVEPTEVRHQRGKFEAAFADHERVLGDNSEKVQRWKAALNEAASITGFDTRITSNGYESQCIQKIVGEILNYLGDKVSRIDKNLVGIESRVEEVISMLCIGSDDVRRIGIWGMGGIGKTTLAKAVFDQIRYQFEGSSYLENVRTRDLELLQEKLLSNLEDMNTSNVYMHRLRCKKVLVVIDGVDDVDQIDRLVGEGDWFGLGSRIIITARDKQLLSQCVDVYEVKLLEYDEALELFSRKAFKSDHPQKGYEELSDRVIHYAGYLPLALKVLGRSLFGKDMATWRCAMERLKIIPVKNKKILEILEISLEGLELLERDIFLDIACFFRGKNKDDVIKTLDSFEFHAEIGISILVEKCLIIVSPYGTIEMHDLVQEMGQHVVCRDYPKEPGRRSRLWRCEDVCDVLAKNTGSEAIEGIMLDLPNPKDINFGPDAFKKMDNLRLLIVSNANLSQGPTYLPNNLRSLNWRGYPSESLPESFEPEKLVELKLRCSHIVHPWKGIKKLHKLEVIDFSHSQKLTGIPNFTGAPKLERLILEGCRSLVELHPSVNQLHNLKVINCSHLKNLTRTPDFTGIPKLERLILRGCTSLVELHPSINTLTKLRFLNLRDCESLTSLPSSIQSESLEILNVDGCSKLQKFPEILGNMERLSELYLGRTAIKELPSSIKHLTGLVVIDMDDCENLTSLPSGICMLKCLEILNLSGCSKLDKLPENLGDMDCLKHLNANGIPLKILLSSIFVLNNCKNLTSLPENICRLDKCLESLELSGCSRLDKLPENLWEMECLQVLNVPGSAIMRLPSSITHSKNLNIGMASQLERQDFRSLVLPAIWSYRTLFVLDLSDCFLLDGAIPNDLGCLCFLQILILSRNNVVSLPGSIRQLSRLEEMYLVGCKSLEAVPEFPSNIQQVCTNDCPSLKSIVVPSTNHRSLSTVSFINCLQLSQNRHGDNMADILLQHMLQGIIFFTDQSSIVVPGREIPQWLGDQNMGCSASTQLLPSWCLCRQHLKGVVVCFVSEFTIVSEIRVRFKFKGHGDRELLSERGIRWKTVRNREINSEHVWLCYAGLSYHFNHQPDLLCPNEWCQFEITIVDCGGNEMLGIKKCGVRLVYHEGKDRSGSEAVDECTCEIDRNLPRLSKNIIDFHNFDHPIVSEFIERLYLKIRNGKEYRSETSDEKQWSSSSDDMLGFAY